MFTASIIRQDAKRVHREIWKRVLSRDVILGCQFHHTFVRTEQTGRLFLVMRLKRLLSPEVSQSGRTIDPSDQFRAELIHESTRIEELEGPTPEDNEAQDGRHTEERHNGQVQESEGN